VLYLYCLTCELWDFHIRFIDNSGVSECHAAWRGKWFPIFGRNLSPSSSAVQGPIFMEPDTLKMKVPRSFEASGTTYPAIQRQIPEEWNAHFLNCWIKKCNYIRPKIMFHGPKTIINVVTFMCVIVRVWTRCLALREGNRLKVFHKKVLRNASGWENEASENCIVKRFKTPAGQMLLGWLNGWGLWHDWEERQVNTGFWLEYLNGGVDRNT